MEKSAINSEPLSFNEIVANSLEACKYLPKESRFELIIDEIADLNERLSGGKLRIAVMGQFNRGKSTFINTITKADLLPVSVLPLTSVPTIIKEGEENLCRIKFTDDKENLIVSGREEIKRVLREYVGEKENPRNIKTVKSATVYSNSRFLAHGTVIIDTPGFGSTHIHNTETTIELLSSCDAALFLLSADLPITAVEIEFLKKVIHAVPKIFFIYNKTDLLSNEELSETSDFIRETLKQDLNLELLPQLFPVSAKVAKESGDFKISGFAAIEKEIVDFLMRDKYFVLSEALTTKLEDYLNQIRKHLNSDIDKLLGPIKEIENELHQLRKIIKIVESETAKSEKLFGAEKNAIVSFFNKSRELKEDKIKKAVTNLMEKQFSSISGNDFHMLFISSISGYIENMLESEYSYLTSKLTPPLFKALNAHLRELLKLSNRVSDEIGSENIEISIENRDELIQFRESIRNIEKIEIDKPEKISFGIFSSKDKVIRKIKEYYTPLIFNYLNENFSVIEADINQQLSGIFKSLIENIDNEYMLIFSEVEQKIEVTEDNLAKEKSTAVPAIEKLKSIVSKFENLGAK